MPAPLDKVEDWFRRHHLFHTKPSRDLSGSDTASNRPSRRSDLVRSLHLKEIVKARSSIGSRNPPEVPTPLETKCGPASHSTHSIVQPDQAVAAASAPDKTHPYRTEYGEEQAVSGALYDSIHSSPEQATRQFHPASHSTHDINQPDQAAAVASASDEAHFYHTEDGEEQADSGALHDSISSSSDLPTQPDHSGEVPSYTDSTCSHHSTTEAILVLSETDSLPPKFTLSSFQPQRVLTSTAENSASSRATADTAEERSKMSDQQKGDSIKQIANVSKLLRDAIHAALPVSPEQYLTIAVPGTTIDVRDIKDSGTFVWDSESGAFTPLQVKQAEAKLVDNMMPLSFIMVRNSSCCGHGDLTDTTLAAWKHRQIGRTQLQPGT